MMMMRGLHPNNDPLRYWTPTGKGSEHDQDCIWGQLREYINWHMMDFARLSTSLDFPLIHRLAAACVPRYPFAQWLLDNTRPGMTDGEFCARILWAVVHNPLSTPCHKTHPSSTQTACFIADLCICASDMFYHYRDRQAIKTCLQTGELPPELDKQRVLDFLTAVDHKNTWNPSSSSLLDHSTMCVDERGRCPISRHKDWTDKRNKSVMIARLGVSVWEECDAGFAELGLPHVIHSMCSDWKNTRISEIEMAIDAILRFAPFLRAGRRGVLLGYESRHYSVVVKLCELEAIARQLGLETGSSRRSRYTEWMCTVGKRIADLRPFYDDKDNEEIIACQTASEIYRYQLSAARKGVVAWILCARRLGVNKDVRRMISMRLWSESIVECPYQCQGAVLTAAEKKSLPIPSADGLVGRLRPFVKKGNKAFTIVKPRRVLKDGEEEGRQAHQKPPRRRRRPGGKKKK